MVQRLDALIIDEVSMVRCDLLDMVDEILRHYHIKARLMKKSLEPELK